MNARGMVKRQERGETPLPECCRRHGVPLVDEPEKRRIL